MSGQIQSLYYIKVKEIDRKTWKYLTLKGGVTRTLVHAGRFEKERADALVQDVLESNTDWDAKVHVRTFRR